VAPSELTRVPTAPAYSDFRYILYMVAVPCDREGRRAGRADVAGPLL
jgi:hypothetical protein